MVMISSGSKGSDVGCVIVGDGLMSGRRCVECRRRREVEILDMVVWYTAQSVAFSLSRRLLLERQAGKQGMSTVKSVDIKCSSDKSYTDRRVLVSPSSPLLSFSPVRP